jgi:DNA-binding CsgD family transcriptional regulator
MAPPGPGTGPCQWITDDHLEPLPQARSLAAAGLLGELLAADGSRQRQHLLRAALRAARFDWLAFGTLRVEASQVQVLRFFATYAEPEWTARYFEHRFHEVDPRHAELVVPGLPRPWAAEPLATRCAPLGARHEAFARALRRAQPGSGVFVGLALPGRRHERVTASLSSRVRSAGWIGSTALARAALLALTVHEFLGLHTCAGDEAGTLPPLQRDILQGLADGATDRELSQRLRVSIHTVDYHMRRLRQHFGARNRAQLVSLALEMGAEVG